MLSFERPPVEVEGVLLFPDHDEPLVWYYTAGAPRVAIGPASRPMFDLWVYTEELVQDLFSGTQIPDEMGGGFLTLGVNCRRDKSQLDKAKKELAEVLGLDDAAAERLSLSPIPYSAGAVRIIALDALSFPPGTPDPVGADPNAGRPRFVTSVEGASKPALLGDLQAIFSLSLSERGAAFMAGLFEGGGTPVGVVYELTYEGLSPAVDVTITADMTKVRTHFGGGLQGQVSWFKADVSAALDDLVQKQVVKIDSTRILDTDAAKAAEERALTLFKEDLIQQLFRPTTPVPPRPDPGASAVQAITQLAGQTGQQAAGAATGGSLGLTLKFQHETSDLSGVYNYSARMPLQRTDAPQAFLQTMVKPADHADHTTVIDLGNANEFFGRIDAVVSLPDDEMFDKLNLRQALVSITYGEDDPSQPPEIRPPLLCVKGGERHRPVSFLRRGRDSMSLAYDVAYQFDDDPDTATVDESSYQTERRISANRAVVVDPLADFGYRSLALRPGRIPADVSQITVLAGFSLPAGGFNASRSFRLLAPFERAITEVAPDGATWAIRTKDQQHGIFGLNETYKFTDGSTWTRPAFQTEAPFHSIDTPFQGQRELLIQPNIVSQSIDAIDVEVEYEDEAANYLRRFFLTLMPPFASQRLNWSVLDPAKRTVRVRTTVREGGITSQTDWEETDEPTKIVGSDAARPNDLTVRLIGGELTAFQIDAVVVEVRSPDENGQDKFDELFFAPGDAKSGTITLIRRPGQPMTYAFRTRTFKSSGAEALSDWVDRSEQPNLIISLVNL